MDTESNDTELVARAMEDRDRAKHNYEQLRGAYRKREVTILELNQALIAYAEAVNVYHDVLASMRRPHRIKVDESDTVKTDVTPVRDAPPSPD